MGKGKTKDAEVTAGVIFPTLWAVMEDLEKAGFRISKSKIYRDRDKGMIRVNGRSEEHTSELQSR